MMELVLTRRWRAEGATIGTVTVDGVPLCYSLEDPVRARDDDGSGMIEAAEVARVKVPGETAIPAGRYRVEMDASPKFGRVPHVRSVPGFTDILIHKGNRAVDTRGCILPGMTRSPAAVGQSGIALSLVVEHIEAAEARGEVVWLEIREEPEVLA